MLMSVFQGQTYDFFENERLNPEEMKKNTPDGSV
jgi:hypothetical protein